MSSQFHSPIIGVIQPNDPGIPGVNVPHTGVITQYDPKSMVISLNGMELKYLDTVPRCCRCGCPLEFENGHKGRQKAHSKIDCIAFRIHDE